MHVFGAPVKLNLRSIFGAVTAEIALDKAFVASLLFEMFEQLTRKDGGSDCCRNGWRRFIIIIVVVVIVLGLLPIVAVIGCR